MLWLRAMAVAVVLPPLAVRRRPVPLLPHPPTQVRPLDRFPYLSLGSAPYRVQAVPPVLR